jgi:hypothetical protein
MLRTLTALFALFFIVAAVACSSSDDDDSGSSSGAGDTPAASDSGGGSDDGDSDDGGDDSDDDPQPVDSGGSSGGGVGAIQAGGLLFDVNEVRRCEPFFDGDDNLDLQALASDGVILFVVINTPLGNAEQLLAHELTIQGSGITSEGGLVAFSATANSTVGGPFIHSETDEELPGPPFTINGDRISGALTLSQALGGTGTLDVSFDIPIPADIIEC